jgi:high-affinity nickel-transport protein
MKKNIAVMAAVVLAINVLGWGGLLWVIANGGKTANYGLSIAIGWTVFTLGMRHAFDADHIAAIDNTTRKLVNEGKRTPSVGLWFSLGHSTVVFVVCALLAGGVRILATELVEDDSAMRNTFGIIGTSVSSLFLIIIGVINTFAMVGLWRTWRSREQVGEAELEKQLASRGLIARLLGNRLNAITEAWQIYPVGLLFGLGFDTATEVGLFAIAGGTATLSLPWYAVLTLPLIFAGGMSFFDALDGLVMNYAYGWAAAGSQKFRVGFNLVVTAMSVAMALVIGVVEAGSVLGDLGVTFAPVRALASVDLGSLGYFMVAAFCSVWIVALLLARANRNRNMALA